MPLQWQGACYLWAAMLLTESSDLTPYGFVCSLKLPVAPQTRVGRIIHCTVFCWGPLLLSQGLGSDGSSLPCLFSLSV